MLRASARYIFKFLASLKLALLLLAVLVYACAMGTYYESAFNAELAAMKVYKTWWFTGWMMLLVVNLFCVAAIRYPWKPHQTGFVITHAGIITLLAGGMIDRKWGLEGALNLRSGAGAVEEMQLREQELLVFSPERDDPARTPLVLQAEQHVLMESPSLETGSVKDWAKLCAGVAEAGRFSAPAPGKPFWKALDEAERHVVTKAAAEQSACSPAVLAGIFNRTLRNRDLFNARDFAQAKLPLEAETLLAFERTLLSDKEVVGLNRLLLAAAYPDLVSPKSVPRAERLAAAHDPTVQVRILDIQGVTHRVADLAPVVNAGPMALVVLQSEQMGVHTHAVGLGESLELGPARLRFARGMPPDAHPAPAVKNDALVPTVERHYVFANAENTDMATQVSGQPTGATSQLVVGKDDRGHVLKIKLQGKELSSGILENVGKTVNLDGLSDWQLAITGFYPDFRMDGGKPTTFSQALNNPCVVYELLGPPTKAGGGASAHGGASPEAAFGDPNANGITLYLGSDSQLRYWVKSRKTGAHSGVLVIGVPIDVSWARGATFTVQKMLLNAAPVLQWFPVSESSGQIQSGILCEITAAEETKRVWAGPLIGRGPRGTPVEVGGKTLDIAWDARRVKLPFSVELLHTRAPHQEGLAGTGSFMAFESVLSFEKQRDEVRLKTDSKLRENEHVQLANGILRGAIHEVNARSIQLIMPFGQEVSIPHEDVESWTQASRKIHMNNPTSWPATWYAPWVGSGYKFSQADHGMLHNPPDPDFSGVQVLRDPGWMPKWVGCLMICFGIFTMFYLKPYFKRVAEPSAGKGKLAGKVQPPSQQGVLEKVL